MGEKKTVAVIGGGSAGLTAARMARFLGAKVLFFMGDNADRASLCVNEGCMPSKAMFEPIDAMHAAARHGWLKIEPKEPSELLASIVAWKDREVARFRALRQRFIARQEGDGFEIHRCSARFAGPHILEAEDRRYEVDAVILATGSVPLVPPIEGLRLGPGEVWTHEEILHNRVLPGSLAVIGAGAIGLEFSLRYARLGCAVSLVSDRGILPMFPERFGRAIAAAYAAEGIDIYDRHRVGRIRRDPDGLFLLELEGPDGYEPLAAERVLLAVGRRPALDGLGLETAGVERKADGTLDLGEDMRLAGHPHIFAAGDASGRRMVVHHAHIEAGIAAENAVTGGNRRWTKRSNLQVVFSDPEFAHAGLTAEEAEAAGHRIATSRAESAGVGKLRLLGDRFGFGEIVADADDGRVLGVGLVCSGAGDLIHLPGYAIDHGHTVAQLSAAEYYHPTRMEIVSDLADDLCRSLGGTPFCRSTE